VSDAACAASDRARRAAARGFTLVEILVAVLLLGFVVLSVMALLTAIMHQNQLAQERSTATALASERVARLMSEPFHGVTEVGLYKLPDETLAAGPPATLTSDYGELAGHPEFRRVVTLTYDVPAPGMLRVESKVTWKNLKQGEKTHAMVTYLHPGLEQR
jgi:prepilin-type N-terminal cleavage/methylation domain-containing protein